MATRKQLLAYFSHEGISKLRFEISTDGDIGVIAAFDGDRMIWSTSCAFDGRHYDIDLHEGIKRPVRRAIDSVFRGFRWAKVSRWSMDPANADVMEFLDGVDPLPYYGQSGAEGYRPFEWSMADRIACGSGLSPGQTAAVRRIMAERGFKATWTPARPRITGIEVPGADQEIIVEVAPGTRPTPDEIAEIQRECGNARPAFRHRRTALVIRDGSQPVPLQTNTAIRLMPERI